MCQVHGIKNCTRAHIRTHIDIDDDVLNQVQKLGNFSTKKAAIQAALNDYLDGLKRQKLLALRGKVAECVNDFASPWVINVVCECCVE